MRAHVGGRMFDWSDGTYELTAAVLAPAAEHLVGVAEVGADEHVLDLGCGTGNVSARVVARRAQVTGVDPAARLVEVAAARVPGGRFLEGSAEQIPAAAASFDAVVSCFALIFVGDPGRAASEIARVLRPGGRLVFSAWMMEGAIWSASAALMATLARHLPAPDPSARPAWHDPAFVAEWIGPYGGALSVEVATLPFEATSGAAWFAEQEEHHPAWRAARRALEPAGAGPWEALRRDSVEILEAANEATSGLRVTSPYRVYRWVKAGA